MATSATGASTRHGASQTLRRVLLFAGIAVVLGVGLWILAPSFYRPANLLNVARQASFVGVIAIGQTFVILTGGIDLSVGAASAVCGVITAELAVRAPGLSRSRRTSVARSACERAIPDNPGRG